MRTSQLGHVGYPQVQGQVQGQVQVQVEKGELFDETDESQAVSTVE